MPDLTAPTLPRPRYSFTIPESARAFPSDPHQFIIVPITVSEEKQANEVAEGTKSPLIFELIKHAVVELDGRPLSWNGTERDWIDRASPKVRELVFAAFAKVNKPDADEMKSFLDSLKMEAA